MKLGKEMVLRPLMEIAAPLYIGAPRRRKLPADASSAREIVDSSRQLPRQWVRETCLLKLWGKM